MARCLYPSLLLVSLLVVNLLPGQDWSEQILTASDGAERDYFGASVSLSSSAVFVGAKAHESWSGAVYVYGYDLDEEAWVENQKLTPSLDSDRSQNFGISTALSGNAAIIGAPGLDGGGAAYVFRYDADEEWVEEQILFAEDGVDDVFGGMFGSSVAISGDVAVVGAIGVGFFDGAAYVFRYDADEEEWVEEQEIEGCEECFFGFSAAVVDDVAQHTSTPGTTFRGKVVPGVLVCWAIDLCVVLLASTVARPPYSSPR